MANKNLDSFVFDPMSGGIAFGEDYQIEDSSKKNVLEGLRQMNIFVGANNSGKSRILRAIFQQKNIVHQKLLVDFLALSSELEGIINSSSLAAGQFEKTKKNLLDRYKQFDQDFFWADSAEYPNLLEEAFREMENHLGRQPDFFTLNRQPEFQKKLIEFLSRNKPRRDEFNNTKKISLIEFIYRY